MDVVFQKDKQKNSPLLDKFKGFLKKVKNFKPSSTFYYFLALLLTGFGFYVLMLFENNFSLAYGGDYSAQYIPMGYHIWDYYHEWIYTGHFTLFDQTLYLGVNSIGSNAYYGLFSPFNIIIVLLPRTIVPQSVAICSIVKLACAGLFFSFYMTGAFGVKDKVARLCGIAYAFCGWGCFYLWYNNYQDILVFFPLILWGIEKTIKEFKPWLLALGVFFLAICNYVLMVPYIICAFFYAMFRFFQQIRQHNAKDNFIILGYGVLGFAGGLLMSMCVFGPAFMATMSSPKLDTNSYSGLLKDYLYNKKFKEFFELLFSWEKAADQHGRIFKTRVYYPILEFFFPATTCRSLPTLELYGWDFDDIAVSLWCYVPFILFLVPALIQSGTEKKWSHYIGFTLLVVSLFTPVMYFLTMGFTNGYARWTLFIITSLLAYVGIYIDKIPNVAKWQIHIGFFFAILGIIAAWVITWKIYVPGTDKSGELIHRFVEKKNNETIDYTNLAYVIELAYVTVVYLTLFFLYNKKAFHILITIFASAEAVAVGNFVTIGHGYDTRYNNGYAENERFRTVLTQVQNNDQSFYRIYTAINDAYSTNNSFINNYHSVSFFHSLYNFEIDDFTLWTGIRNGSKSVSGDYRGKYQDLDNLLGVKYYFISKQKSKYDLIETNYPGGYIANVPFDFEESKEYEKYTDEYLVFENKSLSQFGYSYDTIYNGQLDGADKGVRYNIESTKNIVRLAQTAVVSEDDGVEINTVNSDISLVTEKPEVNSIRELYLTSDYYHYFYNVTAATKQHAKYYDFADIPNIPDKFEAGTFERKEAMNYFVFLTSKNVNQPLLKEGTSLYIHAPFSGSQKFDFYFLDKDNKIFMYDAHDDDSTDNVSQMRGFYIKKDVYRIAVCGKYFESYLDSSTIRLYVEDKAVYDTRRDTLNANPIENVQYQTDKFTFDTNYDRNLFVVSRVAYDKGWSIKAVNNDTGEVFPVKVYKGNGGFVSFVAPKGHISYTMTYMTPYLKASYLVTAFSVTGFFVSLFGYHIYHEKKKDHYLDNIGRNI